MSDRKEKLRKWIRCCLPETEEEAEFECMGCPFEDCHESGMILVPEKAMDEIRKLQEEENEDTGH